MVREGTEGFVRGKFFVLGNITDVCYMPHPRFSNIIYSILFS